MANEMKLSVEASVNVAVTVVDYRSINDIIYVICAVKTKLCLFISETFL